MSDALFTLILRRLPVPGRSMIMAALLVLTAVLVGLPADQGSAAHHAADPQKMQHATPAQAVTGDMPRAHHDRPPADCEPSASGCCPMPHCQPALLVAEQVLFRIAARDETGGPTPVRGSGSDPGIILPPPRHVWSDLPDLPQMKKRPMQ